MLRMAAGSMALGLAVESGTPFFGWTAGAEEKRRKLLVLTRSQNYEHSCLARKNKHELSLLEKIVTDLGQKHGFDATCTKDGRVFVPDEMAKYDAFLFETTGDLAKEGGDDNPPMPPDGKKALLDAVAGGKGFVGCHCASDTFHGEDKIDPYIAMVGGEFIDHGSEQKAFMRVTDSSFPATKDLKDFELFEEWYALKNFAPDLHVILVQDTNGMKGDLYQRPNYPATWARRHEKGRVFYTSMGHRPDVWENATFQAILLGGLSWAFGNVEAQIPPNLKEVTPKASETVDEKAWKPLFNGKDLTGWKTHPKDKANWEVKDGILIGSSEVGHLFSERGDYENFRYRVEAMINDGGNSGQYFRTAFGPSFPKGYEAQINATHTDKIRTGSLYGFGDKATVLEAPHKPDEWFTQEVIAVGNHIIIKVNGKTTVDFVDEKNTYQKGHFALQQHDPKTVVKFRKIEVIELPAGKEQ
jgi:type 1 glutamine amidotransferase